METVNEEALREACHRAKRIMQEARDAVDAEFGGGFANAHPELVGAFMGVVSTELNRER